MASRRPPLANVPNAINSPLRTAVPSTAGKRTRAQAGEQREAVHGQPPTKKQIIELPTAEDVENVDPKKRGGVAVTPKDKLHDPFAKRNTHAHPAAFEKKLASVREKKQPVAQQRAERPHRQQADNLESIRQWQKHYRRQFPHFVFYFDGVSEDVRARAIRQIYLLGAREEKFFSKAVTHVVTTRPIPAESLSTSPDDEAHDDPASSRTVQPSALTQESRKSTNVVDAHLQRRSQHSALPSQLSLDSRKPHASGADILTRARALGIKIWALEKLNRVLSTILDTETGDHHDERRTQVASLRTTSRQAHDADLEQLLRHEKVNGPADRDMTVATQDMTTLRGFYIYVHDMDERTKPALVRDYAKPSEKESGKWPQFRLSAPGRCPFIEDPSHARRLEQQERQARARAQQELVQRRTRARGSLLPGPAQSLAEREANLRRSPRKLAQAARPDGAKPLDPPAIPDARRQSSAEGMPPLFGSAQASLRCLPRMVGGEPVASGVQPSNVTSAIRSQAISSAAISSTAPGLNRRMGDTKEVSLLKRKVLASNNGIPSSYANDVRAAINDSQDPPPRAAKRKAQETLGVVHEDEATAEGSGSRARTSAPKKSKTVKKEAKPGYCENCRDKFDDFDDVSRADKAHQLHMLTIRSTLPRASIENSLSRQTIGTSSTVSSKSSSDRTSAHKRFTHNLCATNRAWYYGSMNPSWSAAALAQYSCSEGVLFYTILLPGVDGVGIAREHSGMCIGGCL